MEMTVIRSVMDLLLLTIPRTPNETYLRSTYLGRSLQLQRLQYRRGL